MPITDSGEIRFSDVADEYDVTLSDVSLGDLSADIGLEPEHALSEFYGKSADLTIGDLTNTITTDDDGVALNLQPTDGIYFDGYHFISDDRDSRAIFSDDDGISWSTDYTSLFDRGARFTKQGDYLMAVSYNYIARYMFTSDPNSDASSTYFTDLDMYRTKIETTLTLAKSNAVYYNGSFYFTLNSLAYAHNPSTGTTGFSGAVMSTTSINDAPLAVGNDGRMITVRYSATQPVFVITDNLFASTTTVPLPSFSQYNYGTNASTSNLAGSKLTTNGNGTWVFSARLFLTERTLYCYSTDNGESWTCTLDYFNTQGVMTYNPGGSNTANGNFGDVENARFVNNKFFFTYADGRLRSSGDNGGVFYSSDGSTLNGFKNMGSGGRTLSFNGSTVVIAGNNKILRFT